MEYFRQRFIDELNDEGDIEIRSLRWTRHEILESMDQQAAQTAFGEWVEQIKYEAKDRVREFLTENGCLDRFRALCHRHQQRSVVPFIGAGMSIPSGFQPWATFLLSLIPDAPHLREEVQQMIDAGRYEDAAQHVEDTLGPDIMAEEIHNRLGAHHQRTFGPVKLLPFLFQAEVITTNFDHILPAAYRNCELAFLRDFCGAELPDVPRRLANDPHCLLRLHGAAETLNGRVLTTREYNAAYRDDGIMGELLERIISMRSLLFLGCSLQGDRTYAALQQIRARAQVQAAAHYAFLPLPADDRMARRQFLAGAGIHPIYYPADTHDQSIEDLLVTMIEGGPDDR